MENVTARDIRALVQIYIEDCCKKFTQTDDIEHVVHGLLCRLRNEDGTLKKVPESYLAPSEVDALLEGVCGDGETTQKADAWEAEVSARTDPMRKDCRACKFYAARDDRCEAYRLGVTCKEGDHWREKPFTPLWSVEK